MSILMILFRLPQYLTPSQLTYVTVNVVRSRVLDQRWQTGQKNVERPAWTVRLMVPGHSATQTLGSLNPIRFPILDSVPVLN